MASQGPPEGFVLVPKKPTEAMLAAMRDAFHERTSWGALDAYRAMVLAALQEKQP